MRKKSKAPPEDSPAPSKTAGLTRQQRIDLIPMASPDDSIYSSGWIVGSAIVIKHDPDGDEEEK